MKKDYLICTIALYLISLISLGYFVFLTVSVRPSMPFNIFWLVVGLGFLGLGITLSYAKKGFMWMPKPLVMLLQGIILVGLLLFVVVEGMIVISSTRSPKKEADYIILLGAKVNGTTPSLILQYRIEKAYEYMEAHPDVIAVLSGGKGDDEGISEAEAMRQALINKGIAQQRLLLEIQSTSTKENLQFTRQLLEQQGIAIDEKQFLVVSTDFHILRATRIAKKAGFVNVEGLAAKSVWYLIPSNYVREFLAILKDFVMGNC